MSINNIENKLRFKGFIRKFSLISLMVAYSITVAKKINKATCFLQVFSSLAHGWCSPRSKCVFFYMFSFSKCIEEDLFFVFCHFYFPYSYALTSNMLVGYKILYWYEFLNNIYLLSHCNHNKVGILIAFWDNPLCSFLSFYFNVERLKWTCLEWRKIPTCNFSRQKKRRLSGAFS